MTTGGSSLYSPFFDRLLFLGDKDSSGISPPCAILYGAASVLRLSLDALLEERCIRFMA